MATSQPNFGVDNPSKFEGSCTVNLLEGSKTETFRVQVQLLCQSGQSPPSDSYPQYLQVYGPTYNVEVTAVRKNNQVTLYIPAISLTIPNVVVDSATGSTIAGGPSYLMVTGCFIPHKFRPTTMSGVSFAVGSNVTNNPPYNPVGFPSTPFYQGTVYRNGSFRYALQGGYPIPSGQLIADATWVNYVSNPYITPSNFLISTWGRSDTVLPVQQSTPSNPVPPVVFPYPPPNPFPPGTIDYFTRYSGYIEYNYIVALNGHIYALFADNSHTPSTIVATFPGYDVPPQIWPGYANSGAFAKFKIEDKRDKDQVKVKQVIAPNYIWGPEHVNAFQGESGLAVNPVNPNIVVAALSITALPFFYGVTTTPVQGIAYMYSTDGGKTFAEYTLFKPGDFGVPGGIFGYDQGLYFDRFGNLWFTALSASLVTEVPLLAYTFVSPMGDPSKFRLIQSYGVPGFPTGVSVDYPRSRTGPGYPDGHSVSDGGQPESCWTSMFNNLNIVPNDTGVPNLITGIQIYGPVSQNPNDTTTNIGPIVQFSPPSTADGQPSDFLIGPGGDVLLISIGAGDSGLLSSDTNYNVMYGNYNPQGVYGQFGNRLNIGYISEGSSESIGPMTGGPAPYGHSVGSRIQGDCDRSNSKYRGRFYVVFVDKKEITPTTGLTPDAPSNKQIIGLTWSDNKGAGWADPIQVNNDIEDNNSHFNPCISLDQKTGNIVIAFYDARTDPKNQAVNWVGAVITPELIESIENLRKQQYSC